MSAATVRRTIRRGRWWTLAAGAASAAFAAAATATTAGAQLPGAPPWTVLVAGVSASSPLMVDGNGTRVRLAPAPTATVHVTPRRWLAGPIQAGIVARAASATIRLDDADEHWSAGRAWQMDLLAQASFQPWQRVTLAAGAGATWLRASRRPAPLQHARLSPAAEATVVMRPYGPSWAVVLTGQGHVVRPATGRAGGVGRLIVGVGRGF